jgi:hypothetical protein
MLCWNGSNFLLRNLLLDALMWSCLVEVRHIGIEDAVELLLMEDEQMIEALTPHTTQEPLTDGIGAWGVIGGFENLDACAGYLKHLFIKLEMCASILSLASHLAFTKRGPCQED